MNLLDEYLEYGSRINNIAGGSSYGNIMVYTYSSFIWDKLLYTIEIQNEFDMLEFLIAYHNLKIEALLNTAAKEGHLSVVKYLIENKNTDRNFKVNGALILAVEKRHLNIVKYLVEKKSVDQNLEISKALILAAENGYLDIVKYLTKNKDINHDLKIDSALIVAAERGDLDIVRYFIEEHGHEPENIDQLIDKTVYSVYSNIDVMRYLIDEKKYIQLDKYPYTKLLSKRTLRSINKVKYFIEEKNCDINDQDENGNTVLHNAALSFNYDRDEYIKIIELLVNHPGIDLNRKNNARQTPLMCSGYYYHVPQIKKIILNAQEQKNSTPISMLNNLEKMMPIAAQNTAEKGR